MQETMSFEEIVPTIEKVKDAIVAMEQKLTNLAKELEIKEQQLTEREGKLSVELERSQQLQNDYLEIQKELSKISELYQEVSGKQEDVTSVKEILGIYITLLEKVFSGKPHAKILFLLHGDKDEMNREELTKSTGFTAAAVRYAISELSGADLVDFNEETTMVKLRARIY